MVHQHFKLVENYTVTENIVLGMEPIKRLFGVLPMVNIKLANEKVRELSARYGLEVDPTAKIEDLKVYARQRVEILKMLYREADILIFDEPTALLTPQEISALLDIIRKLRDSGKTIILISHKLEEIKQVADRCAILNRGRLTGLMSVATTSTATMANLMVGRELSLDIQKPPARFGKTVLEIKNLSVENKHRVTVIKNVSFSVREGEIFAIAGVSGNGQVEVADAVTGMCAVKSGNIILNGDDITHKPVRARNDAGISYIPEDRQRTGLILDFSLAENLALKKYHAPPFCNGMILKRDTFERYAAELIERYDIRGGGVEKARSMSGGNQQKAIIAREIERQSSLTIFVQPTQGLDIGAIMDIREKMIRQRDSGKAVLLISLELDEVLACADTIGVMYNGEMIKTASASSISADEVGEYMMGVKKYAAS
jgi:simple sugar transport system ATP-binding protein